MNQYLDEVIDLVDTAATNAGIDWAFLQDCVGAYPPDVSDHHCSSLLTNVVARCVIRTQINEEVDEIPAWTLEYLVAIRYSRTATGRGNQPLHTAGESVIQPSAFSTRQSNAPIPETTGQ